MMKEIKMEHSNYTIKYDPTKPWSYRVNRHDEDVTDEIRSNVLDDLILCLAENIENGIELKGITIK